MANVWRAPDNQPSGDLQGSPTFPSTDVWPMQVAPPAQRPFSINNVWPLPSGQGPDNLLPPGSRLPSAGDYKHVPSEPPSKAPPAVPMFKPSDSSNELPSPLGGGTTIFYTGVGVGLGLAKAGLFSEGVTGSVLAGGLKFGAAGLGLGIAGGLIHYGLVKAHSSDIAYDGMLAGAALNVARVVGLSGASRAGLLTAGLKGGVTGFFAAGVVGIGAYELNKHHIL